ncbi:hypothetical protein [Pararhizobium sp. LjRoot238]|uniref:hypothetical protein n=1 Tax=Pararhizobium sp. LjRoot238 TaxID=3342293 RepID=UPI003ECDF31E
MGLFAIAYDLKKQGQNYTCITDKLKALKAFHSQGSVWILKSTSKPSALRDHLKGCLDENDELLVAEVSDWATWNMQHDATYMNG